MQIKLTTEARFWAKVEKTDTCWLWTAHMARDGYGQFWAGKKLVRAHRYAYELLIGPIPKGLTLDHLCRIRHCVNPADLEPVTHRENILRGEGWSGLKARQTECIHGHPFDEANTYRRPTTGRQCRACNRKSVTDMRARRVHG